MAEANEGSAVAYGDDDWTHRASDAFRALFQTNCEVFFAFNGTAANSLALASLCQSYHSVICAASAHVETDECGAPEFFSNGSKLLVATTDGGKLTPDAVRALATGRSDIHYPKPRAVTITQPTETAKSIRWMRSRPFRHLPRPGLRLHMDGARFANACAALGCSPAEMTWKVGVDVLCFGGTKNGMAVGEAILFFDRALALDFDYRCKQAGQLASKMRFLSRAHGWVFWRAGRGCAMPRTAMPAPGALLPPSRMCPASSPCSGGGQCRLPARAGGGSSGAAGEGVALLHLHRRWRALHVRLGRGSRAGRSTGGRHPRDRGLRDCGRRVAQASRSAICRNC